MTAENELHDNDSARNVLAGLAPRFNYSALAGEAPREHGAFGTGVLNTMPILLAGSLAVSMTLAGSVPAASARPLVEPRADSRGSATPSTGATASTSAPTGSSTATSGRTAIAPSLYTVAAGDTVSTIAGRFGLSTASVLALNGLGWKSLIFPGQSLRLTTAPVVTPVLTTPVADATNSTRYTISQGDTISSIAARFGVSIQSVLTANGLSWSTIIYPAQVISIPGAPEGTSPSPTLNDGAGDSPSAGDSQAPASDATDAKESVADSAPVTKPVAPVAPSTPAPPAETPAPAPAPAPVTTPPAVSGAKYTIKAGDSLSRIASAFGVTVAALRTANNLGTSNVIYAGRTLIIPGITTIASPTEGITLLNSEGQGQAQTIISVGRSLGVSDYGIVIALATAMQESSMRNLNYGHLDSVGLFQQRPSSGWGTVAQLTSPEHAARLFYGGPTNPNRGRTRGLLDISGWASMTVTKAAQSVQISAYPNAYAKWEKSARYWLANL